LRDSSGLARLEHVCGFSLRSIVLAAVPLGEPPPEETRNTSRLVSSPEEHPERGHLPTCAEVVAQRWRVLRSPDLSGGCPKEETRQRRAWQNSLPLSFSTSLVDGGWSTTTPDGNLRREFRDNQSPRRPKLAGILRRFNNLEKLSGQAGDNARERLNLPGIGTY